HTCGEGSARPRAGVLHISQDRPRAVQGPSPAGTDVHRRALAARRGFRDGPVTRGEQGGRRGGQAGAAPTPGGKAGRVSPTRRPVAGGGGALACAPSLLTRCL